MEPECFPPNTYTFPLRPDFALEFCFDDLVRTPPREQAIKEWLEPGQDLAAEMAKVRRRCAEETLHWCHVYMGYIDEGQVLARPYIWDGTYELRVPEEGLFRAMLNRLADALDQPREAHPIIYPPTLVNPARERVWPEWVVLHDSTRGLAGLVRCQKVWDYVRVPF